MSPEGRNAVICSGGGAIGAAVACAFARKDRPGARRECQMAVGEEWRGSWGLLRWIVYFRNRAVHRGQ